MGTLYDELMKKSDVGHGYSDERKLIRELCGVVEAQGVALEAAAKAIEAMSRRLKG